jgi:WD40 repeat protein
MGHLGEVTQLAFLPLWESGGRALVSAGTDGYVRVTCVNTGRTLKRMEVGARAPASMLQVSKDGKLVVTVWGRDVVLWYLETGRMHSYNLDRVRQSEGWPLCVSPDCRYLACRNEEGFDVSDVETGKFRGEFVWTGQPITAAAFDSDGVKLAIGDYGGGVQVFDIITS